MRLICSGCGWEVDDEDPQYSIWNGKDASHGLEGIRKCPGGTWGTPRQMSSSAIVGHPRGIRPHRSRPRGMAKGWSSGGAWIDWHAMRSRMVRQWFEPEPNRGAN